MRAALTAAAVSMAKELRYRGVGTFEFLVDLDDPGRWTFMEANPRLQVEHPVTEAVHGVDLVRAQLLVATGRTLDDLGLRQGDIRAAHGTAIEARITAASSGTVKAFDAPSGPGVRVDTALHRGAQVSPRYDSLLVKVVGHVPGGDVRDAARRTARAVAECVIAGIDTNADLLQGVLTHPEFLAGPVDTGFVERHLPDWAVQADQVNPTTAEPTGRDGARDVGAPLTATVLSVLVEAGQAVSAGQPVAVLESMKMEHLVRAPRHGIVQSVTVAVSDTVAAGDPLLSLLPSDAAADSGEATAATTPATERREYADFVARRHRTTDEGRADAVARRHAAGRRTARQNVADLCDPGSFVEYGTFAIAAQRRRRELMDLIERTPGDGLVSGLARINGGQAAVVSYDYTVLAGTQGLCNHRKTDRLFELADRLRLPVVLFAEGGGGRPGDTDSGGFAALDGPTCGTFARLSGQVPLVGVGSG
ncbi:MAG: biotin/lipoyl-containing protein, partial [Actinomycetes bacterium]